MCLGASAAGHYHFTSVYVSIMLSRKQSNKSSNERGWKQPLADTKYSGMKAADAYDIHVECYLSSSYRPSNDVNELFIRLCRSRRAVALEHNIVYRGSRKQEVRRCDNHFRTWCRRGRY